MLVFCLFPTAAYAVTDGNTEWPTVLVFDPEEDSASGNEDRLWGLPAEYVMRQALQKAQVSVSEDGSFRIDTGPETFHYTEGDGEITYHYELDSLHIEGRMNYDELDSTAVTAASAEIRGSSQAVYSYGSEDSQTTISLSLSDAVTVESYTKTDSADGV